MSGRSPKPLEPCRRKKEGKVDVSVKRCVCQAATVQYSRVVCTECSVDVFAILVLNTKHVYIDLSLTSTLHFE
jgi:hypothetical protein